MIKISEIFLIFLFIICYVFISKSMNHITEGYQDYIRNNYITFEDIYKNDIYIQEDDYPYAFATHPPTDYAIRRENLRTKLFNRYNQYIKLNPFDKKATIQYPCRSSITKEYIDCGPFSYNTCSMS